MSFAIGAILMILLHMGPNIAGAGLSVYKQHGFDLNKYPIIVHQHKKAQKNKW